VHVAARRQTACTACTRHVTAAYAPAPPFALPRSFTPPPAAATPPPVRPRATASADARRHAQFARRLTRGAQQQSALSMALSFSSIASVCEGCSSDGATDVSAQQKRRGRTAQKHTHAFSTELHAAL